MKPQGRRDRRSLWDKFWKDRSGQVVVYQHPNVWLIAWAVITMVSILSPSNTTANLFWNIGRVVLAVWALLEVLKGVNYLRRLLGGFVLLLLIGSVFGIGL